MWNVKIFHLQKYSVVFPELTFADTGLSYISFYRGRPYFCLPHLVLGLFKICVLFDIIEKQRASVHILLFINDLNIRRPREIFFQNQIGSE